MAQTFNVRALATASRPALALLTVVEIALFFTPFAQGQTYQGIHHFTGADGDHPYAGLTIDAGGKLYGTTLEGGSEYGTVFRLARAGSGWVLTTLYKFTGGTDGYYPAARVVFGPDGALYGTTEQGGDPNECRPTSCGTVFRLQPPPTTCKTAACPWIKTIIHNFEGTSHGFDGRVPVGDLTFDRAGNLYGVTENGGQYDDGAVYELTKSGGNWIASTLYSFTNIFGSPRSGVTIGADGNLYGTVFSAYHYYGGVYRLVSSGNGWTEQDIYKFSLTDGAYPWAGIIFDSAGNLYGATSSGGPNGGGTAFELSPMIGGWSLSTLFAFTGPCCGGAAGPVANLIFDQSGDLYGTTYADGQFQLGSIFKLASGSNGWTYASLYDFNDAGVAAYPVSNVSFDASGNLYGTTSEGGTPAFCSGGCGGVWEITP